MPPITARPDDPWKAEQTKLGEQLKKAEAEKAKWTAKVYELRQQISAVQRERTKHV